MIYKEPNKANNEENVFRIVASFLLPYWPLFAFLIPIALLSSWVYLKTVTPLYQASATLIIKDENKGVDDAKLMESINPFESKKIVENELEVLKSRYVMNQVVDSLQLYAVFYEEKTFGSKSAYMTSPIRVELKNPNRIPFVIDDDPAKFYFAYDDSKKKVQLDDNQYDLDNWTEVPGIGLLRFKRNPSHLSKAEGAMYFSFADSKGITRNLLGRLEVGATSKHSTVINLVYKDEIPIRGEDVLNELISAYNQKAIDDRNELAKSTLDFIEERMTNVEKELDELETEIQRFRATEGVVDLSEQGRLYLKDVGDLDREIGSTNRQLAVLSRVERYVVSKKNKSGLVPSTFGVDDPVLTQLLQKLYDSEIEYERLKKTTAENNPILVSVANEIKKIRPSILENIRSQKNNLRASLGSLNGDSNRSNSVLKTLPEKERALVEISRRRAIKKDLFSFLQQKREETALSYAPNGGDGRVVDFAESSSGPVSPNRMLAYLIAVVLASAIGLSYIVGKEMLNNKVLFRTEIEEFSSLPIISELPQLEEAPSRIRKSSTDRTFLDRIYVLVDKIGLHSRYFDYFTRNKNTLSKPYEELLQGHFRQIGAALGLYKRNLSDKRILITSSIPGEGKSFVSKNLAYSFAQAGKKVVLLDMDFVRPNTTKFFSLSGSLGILDLLKGTATYSQIIHKAPLNRNLNLIPVGKQDLDYTKLLLNGKLDFLFDDLMKEFDYIIIDSAPINLVADVNLLSSYSDRTLFIVRHGKTPMQVIRHLEQSNSLKVLKEVSIVFNGVRKRGMLKDDFGYGYGYGMAYNYGYDDDYSYFSK